MKGDEWKNDCKDIGGDVEACKDHCDSAVAQTPPVTLQGPALLNRPAFENRYREEDDELQSANQEQGFAKPSDRRLGPTKPEDKQQR